MNEWMRVIESNIFKNPIQELVRKKLAAQKSDKPVGRPRASSSGNCTLYLH
jgi:hypothetical protein